MATSTTRLGLSKPDGTDVVDIAVLNANADKLDIAAGAYICTSSTRPATPWNGQFIYETDTFTALVYKSSTSTWSPLGGSTVGGTPPSGASKGDLWWDSDTGRLYVYYVDANSSQWVAASNSSTNTVGLVPIVAPTIAVSGGTATANTAGLVSFSGVTRISFNNVFSSAYSTYKIILNIPTSTGNGNIYLQGRLNGVDNAGATAYYSMYHQVRATGAGADGVTNASAANLGANYASSPYFGSEVTLQRTTDNAVKQGWFSSMCCDSTSTFKYDGGILFNSAAVFDGFSIYASAGNITGTIQLFGYNS